MKNINWLCFKFWLCWRFIMALLAHFNWFTAIYVNCAYFTLWKSYDLLWFWMHLFLCICFKPLRSENNLIIFFNLLLSKCGKYRNKSFQQIHNLLYNQRFTKSERALKQLNKANHANDENNQSINDDENLNISEIELTSKKPRIRFVENKERLLYPSFLKHDEEPSMPNSVNQNNTLKGALLTNLDLNENDGSSQVSNSTNYTANRLVKKLPKRLVHYFIYRTTVLNTNSLKTKKKALITCEKLRLKEEKRKQTARQEKINLQRKQELKVLALVERKQKNLASAIDLLLIWLRLMTTFAILVGNIHKTYLPKYLVSPGQDLYNNPDLLMVFTITMSLDILFFWSLMFWTYCQQCRLFCRLGVFRFWLWLITLGFLGGLCMYFPMHMVHEQLDMTWCAFMSGTPLSNLLKLLD